MVKKAKVVGPPEPVALSATAELWTQLVAVQHRAGGMVEKALQRRLGLGFSDFLALRALAGNSYGELRMQELADLTFLNQSSVSRLVGRLERSGLSERRMCENDRRGVYTGITEKGRGVLSEAVPIYERALEDGFGEMAADPELGQLLGRLLPAAKS